MQVLWEVTVSFWMCSSSHPMTQHRMPEDMRLYQLHCENLKSCMRCSQVPFKWITHSSNSKPMTTDTDKSVPDHCTIKTGTQPSIITNSLFAKFYILLTVHRVMILGKWPTWHTNLYYVFIFIFIFNSLHVLSTDLHTTQPPTQSDSYQSLCWHNLSLLMMSMMCSKHVES
jgi:hypothetical protein